MTSQIWEMIGNGVWETVQMTVIATLFAYVAGLPLGILLVVTGKGNILENRILNGVIGTIVNIFRSIPFLILLVLLIPLTRFLVGTSIGTTATIVPLTIGAIPIVARMVESSLQEVPAGIIEAAQAMGASPLFYDSGDSSLPAAGYRNQSGNGAWLLGNGGICRRRRTWGDCNTVRILSVSDGRIACNCNNSCDYCTGISGTGNTVFPDKKTFIKKTGGHEYEKEIFSISTYYNINGRVVGRMRQQQK